MDILLNLFGYLFAALLLLVILSPIIVAFIPISVILLNALCEIFNFSLRKNEIVYTEESENRKE